VLLCFRNCAVKGAVCVCVCEGCDVWEDVCVYVCACVCVREARCVRS